MTFLALVRENRPMARRDLPIPTPPTPAKRHAMQAQRAKDTGPELALRSELHRRGLRFRIHCRPLPQLRRTVDIVFGPARVAVECRGCFWHSCPTHATKPKTNAEWWAAKLTDNVNRDADTATRLSNADWQLVIVWEHEDPVLAADRIESTVRHRSRRR
jgi:DNA mismatch endonuclease, patch repair protein